jgi:hypothetical protein
LIENLIERAGFNFRVVKKYSIFIDSFILYECAREALRIHAGPAAHRR